MKKIECPYCGNIFKSQPTELYAQVKCSKCYEIFSIDEKKAPSLSVHRFKDASAFGYDRKTGRPIALDTHGKRIDPSETRYDLKRDPHGWKKTGKKVAAIDDHGKPNI